MYNNIIQLSLERKYKLEDSFKIEYLNMKFQEVISPSDHFL